MSTITVSGASTSLNDDELSVNEVADHVQTLIDRIDNLEAKVIVFHKRSDGTPGQVDPLSEACEQHRTVRGVDLNADDSFAVTSTGVCIRNVDEMNHRRCEFEITIVKLEQGVILSEEPA